MNPTDKLPLNQQTGTTHHAFESDTKAAANQQVRADTGNHHFKIIDLSQHGLDLSQNGSNISSLMTTTRNVHDFSKITIRPDIYESHIPVYDGNDGHIVSSCQGRINAAKDCNPLTCAQTKAKIKEVVENFPKNYDYNSLRNVCAFLKFFEAERKIDPNISEIDAFKKFKPDTTDEVFISNGSSCTGHSTAILKILEKEYGLKGHVVVETEGPNTPAFHAAAIIPCSDGIALIEVFMGSIIEILFEKPLTLEDEKKLSYRHDFMIVKTPGDYRSKILIFKQDIKEDKKTEKQTEMVLRPVNKSEHTVMKQHIIGADYYPISGRNNHAIKINAIRSKVTFQIGEEEDNKFRLDFSDFKDGWFDDKKLSGKQKEKYEKIIKNSNFFEAFKTKKSLLQEEIIYVTQNGSTLIKLFDQVKRDIPKL